MNLTAVRLRLLLWWHEDVLRHGGFIHYGEFRCECGKRAVWTWRP